MSRCVHSNCGVNRRWAEGTGWPRQIGIRGGRLFVYHLQCFDLELAQCVKSGFRTLVLSFPSFGHVKMTPGTLSLHLLTTWYYFFPYFVQFQFWHAQLRFESDTPAGPLYAHSYWLFLKSLLLGKAFFSCCYVVFSRPLFWHRIILGASCQQSSFVIEHLSSRLQILLLVDVQLSLKGAGLLGSFSCRPRNIQDPYVF